MLVMPRATAGMSVVPIGGSQEDALLAGEVRFEGRELLLCSEGFEI